MAFNSTAGRASYTATASQTVFPFLFKIFDETDIEVYQTPSGQTADDTADKLVLTTDYTVTISGDAGGEITLVTGAGAGDTLVLKRNLPIDRDIEYQTSGDLLAETLNEDQEYQTYLVLDGDTNDGRSIRLPDTDTSMSPNLPTTIANYGLYVNEDGTAFEYRPGDENGATLEAWKSQAHQKTSDSYATEAEDVFVKTYTSDGDGTFTATDTTDYSALHWAAKAATFNPALYATLTGATFTGQVKGITPVANEDLTRKDYVDSKTENIISGTYTPTGAAVSNVDAVIPSYASYIRVGDIVTVYGRVNIDATAGATITSATLTLPIARVTDFVAIPSDFQCDGVINRGPDNIAGVVSYTVGAKTATVSFVSVGTGQETYRYTFSYKVA